jgi:hypothetical protein
MIKKNASPGKTLDNDIHPGRILRFFALTIGIKAPPMNFVDGRQQAVAQSQTS